jgi:hypothetical protein
MEIFEICKSPTPKSENNCWKHIVPVFPAKCSKMAAKQMDKTECINEENSEIPEKKLNDSETQPCMVKKRSDYLHWDEYFMAVAFLSAQRSKDPNSQVGACIVNEEKKIVGIGYNGMPNGCSDDTLPWARKADDDLDTKYPYGLYFAVVIELYLAFLVDLKFDGGPVIWNLSAVRRTCLAHNQLYTNTFTSWGGGGGVNRGIQIRRSAQI